MCPIVEVSIALALPRERQSVATVRRLCRAALAEMGADPDVIDDVEVAVAEACNNAVEHTGSGGYRAEVSLDDRLCRIRICDTGPGFGGGRRPEPPPTAERGRGVSLMRALADRVHFEIHEERGTTVTLEKTLRPAGGAPPRPGSGR